MSIEGSQVRTDRFQIQERSLAEWKDLEIRGCVNPEQIVEDIFKNLNTPDRSSNAANIPATENIDPEKK